MGPIAGTFLAMLVYMVLLAAFVFFTYLIIGTFVLFILDYDYHFTTHVIIFAGIVAIAACLTLIAYVIGGQAWLEAISNSVEFVGGK